MFVLKLSGKQKSFEAYFLLSLLSLNVFFQLSKKIFKNHPMDLYTIKIGS